jgi:uncharacterized membrane protein (DUF106 family)
MTQVAKMIYEYLNYIVATVISTVVGAIGWLVRTVLTNQAQLALLQKEIENRDKRREEDREILKELQSDVKQVKRDILEIYKLDVHK